MTYGIEIKNDSGRIIIDNNYSNFRLVSEMPSLAAVGAVYPTAVTGVEDVLASNSTGQSGLIVRCTADNSVPNQTFWTYNPTPYEPHNYNLFSAYQTPLPANGYRYYITRKVNGYYTPPTSGEGLVVYDSTGQQAQFSVSSENKYAQLVSAGMLNGNLLNPNGYIQMGWEGMRMAMDNYGEPNSQAYFPSATGEVEDLDKYFCMLSTSERFYFFNSAINVSLEILIGYEYIYTGPNRGRIRMINITGPYGTYGSTYTHFYYYIYKING